MRRRGDRSPRLSLASARCRERFARHCTARRIPVPALLSLSRAIDALTERIGRIVYWLILVVVLISAANATIRKVFNYSSNSYLEIQWYLFSAIFLFGAGYTFLRNEH